jgi:hypothetical protein
MLCPVCDSEHTARPIRCLQAASMDHVNQCGIISNHTADCLLKRLNEYVEANPLWAKRLPTKDSQV